MKIPQTSFFFGVYLLNNIINIKINKGSNDITELAIINLQYFIAHNDSQNPPIVAKEKVPINCILYFLSFNADIQLCIFRENTPNKISNMELNIILYIVAVITGTLIRTGFIITIEYAVQISDSNAKIMPVI